MFSKKIKMFFVDVCKDDIFHMRYLLQYWGIYISWLKYICFKHIIGIMAQTFHSNYDKDFEFLISDSVVISFYNTKRTSRWLSSLILDNLETITYGMWRTLYTMMLCVDRNHLLIMILIYNDNFYSCFKGPLSLYLPLFFEIVIVVDYLEYLFYTNHNLQLSMLDIIRLIVDEINLTASLILSYPYINRPAKLNRLNIMQYPHKIEFLSIR